MSPKATFARMRAQEVALEEVFHAQQANYRELLSTMDPATTTDSAAVRTSPVSWSRPRDV